MQKQEAEENSSSFCSGNVTSNRSWNKGTIAIKKLYAEDGRGDQNLCGTPFDAQNFSKGTNWGCVQMSLECQEDRSQLSAKFI